MAQKTKKLVLIIIFIATLGLTISTAAADPPPLTQAENQVAAINCSDTTTNGAVDQSKVQNCLTQSPIVQDIQIFVNFLSGAVGVVVVAVIILGGIQYSAAGDNPQAVTAAKQRITNGLIALVSFLLIFALVQWLIPGGIF